MKKQKLENGLFSSFFVCIFLFLKTIVYENEFYFP